MTKHYSTLTHDVWLPYKFALGPAFHRFFEGFKEEKIWGNVCPSCGKTYVPARTFCPECQVDMGDWVEVPQEGEIKSFMVTTEPFFGIPTGPPFIGALIRLDKTDTNFLHIIGGPGLTEPESIKRTVAIGTRVKAVWRAEKQGEILDISHFEPL
jgi:uncharacterized OB-fold protein